MTIYILLLIALSALGVQNRVSLNKHLELLNQRKEILDAIAIARQAADSVEGPEAVRAWALAHQMQPSAPDDTAQSALFLEAPEVNLTPNQTQLEMWIKWH